MSRKRTVVAPVETRRRVRTSMNIDKDKLRRARRVLGTRTDTDAVEKALDMVLSNAEIEQAIQSVFGQVAGFKVS